MELWRHCDVDQVMITAHEYTVELKKTVDRFFAWTRHQARQDGGFDVERTEKQWARLFREWQHEARKRQQRGERCGRA